MSLLAPLPQSQGRPTSPFPDGNQNVGIHLGDGVLGEVVDPPDTVSSYA